jgi:hypothetical protein
LCRWAERRTELASVEECERDEGVGAGDAPCCREPIPSGAGSWEPPESAAGEHLQGTMAVNAGSKTEEERGRGEHGESRTVTRMTRKRSEGTRVAGS